MIKRTRFETGIETTPTNIQGGGGVDLTRDGEIATDSSDNELKVRLNAATRTVVTEDQTQVLTNKTIDADLNTITDLEVDNLKAGVLNVSTTLSGASDAQLPSALAVKTYVDDKAAAQNEASEISYDPTASGLAATNVQDAIDEVEGVIESHIMDTTDAHDASAISNIPSGNLAATDVQSALNELQGDADTNASSISNHISDASDAHDASAISVVPASGIVATNVQAALEELSLEIAGSGNGDVIGPASSTDNAIVRFDSTTGKLIQNSTVTIGDTGVVAGASIDADTNTITNIENADIKAGAAIDASKIADGSVSNAEFQYIGGLTSDAQAQINSKQATLVNSAGLAAALSDETGTGLVVFNTSPTITGASIQTPSRLDMKQDTLANLFTYASTATDGQLVFATDTEETYVVKNNTLSAVGGGSSGLDTILQLTASEQLSDWSTGDNATFLGGGTLAGTFVKETSTPLHGTASYKYTQAAGSLNDYLASAVFPVDIRFRATQAYLSFPYKYDGATSDIEIVVYDVTNSTVLTSTFDVVSGTNNANQTAVVGAFIPLTCTQVRVGFHVKVLNSGKIFQFDDIELSASVYGNVQINNVTEPASFTPTFTGFGTVTGVACAWARDGAYMELDCRFTSGTSTAVEARVSLPLGLTVSSLASSVTVFGNMGISLTGGNAYTVISNSGLGYVAFGLQNSGSGNGLTGANGTTIGSSTSISFKARVPIKGWTAGSNAIATPTQQISSDSLTFAFKATAINSDTDTIGTFNTYTYASASNTPTIGGTAPTQTTSSMNINGIQVFARAFNATSTTASPARIDVFIGKGLKSRQIEAYSGLAKTTQFSPEGFETAASAYGTKYTYSEITGILVIEAAVHTGTPTSAFVGIDSAGSTPTSGYFVFNASRSPSLVSLPNLAPRIATISDVKTSGTSGGSTSAAVNQTRVLNTLDDPTGIVTSLASNQFVLPSGEYYISGSAPARAVNNHKTRIRNITDSTTVIQGSSERSAVDALTRSVFQGKIVLTSPKTFELQHTTDLAVATSGWGQGVGGDTELYSVITIQKVK